MRKYIAVTMIALLAIAGAGCGSSDPEPLAKADFIQQGDAVCRTAEKEKQVAIEEFLTKSGTGPGNPLSKAEQEEMVSDAVVPPIRKAIDELEELGVPDEPQAEAIVEGADRVVGETEDDPATLAGGSGKDPFGEVSDNAEKYGFKTCFVYY